MSCALQMVRTGFAIIFLKQLIRDYLNFETAILKKDICKCNRGLEFEWIFDDTCQKASTRCNFYEENRYLRLSLNYILY